jgi:hypothetical protein
LDEHNPVKDGVPSLLGGQFRFLQLGGLLGPAQIVVQA